MDTLAPQSVLDHRNRDKTRTVYSDRLTRHQSPIRDNLSNHDIDEVVVPRISQPYRTSFSAITKPKRVSKSRSRSLSPATSSMKSDRSQSKSPVDRKISPKHVTIDSKVTVRHSDSFEDYEEQPGSYDGVDDSLHNESRRSQSSHDGSDIDYSSQISEMTQLIVKEYSSGESNADISNSGSTSNNSKLPPSGHKRSAPLVGSRGRGLPNGRMPPAPKASSGPKNVLTYEYNHDRTVSYRHAITNHYSEEVKNLADSLMEENYPVRDKYPSDDLPKMERSNSVPLQPQTEDNRLTPKKRTVGGSIGNFFRKMSPRLGRKKRDSSRHGSSSSVSDSGHANESDENLSRNKLRSSFMKLIGRKSSKSKSHSSSDGSTGNLSSRPTEETVSQEPKTSSQSQLVPASSSKMLRSIEQSSMSDKDVYQKFKDKRSPNRPVDTAISQGSNKPQPIKALGEVTSNTKAPRKSPSARPTSSSSMDSFRTPDREAAHKPRRPYSGDVPDIVRDITPSVQVAPKKPPRLLHDDNMEAKAVRQVHAPVTMNADESIGDCSLDVNFTASEPSLLGSGSQGSLRPKQQVLDDPHNILTLGSEGALSPIAASTPTVHVTHKSARHTQGDGTHDNVSYSSMPKLADCAEISIPEYTKSPSYLKLSCSVSGYGRFSQYSSYKDIEKRSPYSSVSSSRSDLLSPDMPVTRMISPVQRTNSGENGYELGLISPQPLASRLGNLENGDCNGISNGHSLPEDSYPTGEPKVDGEYFLQLTHSEENRLLSHCRNVESDLHCCDLPEEATGKIRAAIGKANLLINQKCKQFQELCIEHMDPSEDSKLLKWEDLQGFWDMIKLQIDNIDAMFTEIELSRQNGWKEINIQSQTSSANSSPKSGSLSLSNASTPSGTPGSKRKALKSKDTPESSPERTEKMRQAARAREDARKKMLAEKRAAMRQKNQKANQEVEIYVQDCSNNK